MQRVLKIPQGVTPQALLEMLPLKPLNPVKELHRACYLDTFDGRIDGVDWLLHLKEGELVLDRGEQSDRMTVSKAPPLMASDLPDTPAAGALRGIIENRALLSVLALDDHIVRWALVDGEEKTHLFIEHHHFDAKDTHQADRLVLKSLRGYEKSLKKCLRTLEKAGCESAALPVEEWVAAALPKWPKPVALEAKMEALEAFRTIALYQLEVMALNEAGVISAEDVEFLHDFRVALRRTRSLLGQLKGVLSADVTAAFKADFSWLGSQTGRVRDLDVWLEQLSEQIPLLPQELQGGMAPLVQSIRNDQRRHKRALDKVITGESYQSLKERWRTLLTQIPPETKGPKAAEPIGQLAAKRLHKRIKRVLKDGRAITPASPDDHFHTLRIDCKKARYLLEFFGPLFASRTMKRMIKQLKKLQSTLGAFQDITTQRHNINEALDRMRRQKKLSSECLMATGALLNHLQQEHDRLRACYFKEFEAFSDEGLSGAVLLELKAQKGRA